MPVLRNNTPENPQELPCFLEIEPIFIKRSFHIRLLVNKDSISKIL